MGKSKKPNRQPVVLEEALRVTPTQKDLSPLKAQTQAQANYINAINVSSVTFGVGPAGTGKTFCAATLAADHLQKGMVKRIVITRPAIEAGESIGFLPGELEEKFAPYFAPVREILSRRMGSGHVEALLKGGKIIVEPLAFMRGRTFDDAFVLFDEAQNCTPKQMKMFLTRLGQRTKAVIDGDPEQSDIIGPNGLISGLNTIRHFKWCSVVEFGIDDVVRSGIAGDIIRAYAKTNETEAEAATIDKELPFLKQHAKHGSPR